MMKTESLKKLGILGVSFGLMASPLAFADMHEEDEKDTAPQEETMQDEDQGSMNSYDTEDEQGDGTATEYEEEEEEKEFSYEEEEEEQEEFETEEDDTEEDSDW